MPPPSESELLAMRLTRMKFLIESLEIACSQSAETRETFARLTRELDAARDTLKPDKP